MTVAALILEPASAVAVAKCLTARTRPVAVLMLPDYHPRPCAWEDFDRAELARMLDDFNFETSHGHPAVERFQTMTKEAQARLVMAAQYGEDQP